MRGNRGITLVALVVTIVIMLILAAISINLAFGDDGIFGTAKQASLNQRVETVKEKITFEMTGITARALAMNTPITAQAVMDHFEKLDWVASVMEVTELASTRTVVAGTTVRVITTDKVVIDIKIDPYKGFELVDQGEENGEPYPTINVEQQPLTGVAGETIKIKVTASVEIKGETTGIDYVENVTTGERKDYAEGGVTFEIIDNGEYTFKAVTNKGKTRTKKISVNVASAGQIDISAEPTSARNTIKTETQNGVGTGPIVVTITYGEVSLSNTNKYQYRVGTNGSWQRTDNNVVTLNVSENTEIVASYYDGTNTIGVKNYSIQNVDNVAPSNLSASVTGATSNSITVTATANDTASSGAGENIAGIERYEYSIDGQTWQEESTLSNLNHGTDYTIHVKAIDKAGNETTTTIPGRTEQISGADAIGFKASTTSPTQGSITVEITYAGSYTLMYKQGNGSWTPYTSTLSVSENQTIYAKAVDNNNQEGEVAEYPVTWIDTTLPGTPSLSVTSGSQGNEGWYTSNVTVTITNGTDANVSHTEYSVNGATATTGNSVTISAEGTSTITAYTYDTAGNKSATAGTITIKKDSVGPTFSGLDATTVTSYTAATFTDGVSISDGLSGVTSSTSFSYTPQTLNSGANTITYTATDKAGNTTTQTRTITYNYNVCFVEGTKVSTPNGLKNIEELEAGEYVYTYNEKTGEVEEKPILRTFINEAKEITTIGFANGEEIENTPAHPYYVVGKGWKETKDLSIGDKILTQEGEEIEILTIETEERETMLVYNLNIQDNHNYFVGVDGLLVHNVTSGGGGCGLSEYPID